MTRLADRRASIEDEIPHLDELPHTDTLISLELGLIAREFGEEEANRAIRDFGLTQLGWAEKVL